MKRFEYFNLVFEVDSVDYEKLNEKGEQGWQVVATYNTTDVDYPDGSIREIRSKMINFCMMRELPGRRSIPFPLKVQSKAI